MTALRFVRSTAAPGPVEPFDAFFTREYPRAVKLAWMLTRSASAAEDVAQESMLSMHQRYSELDSPGAYLTRVVVNRARTWHRQGAAQVRLVTSLTNTPTSLPSLDAGEEYLLDIIGALPYRQRVVIVARYWGGWSEADIAAALGCRPGTVKSLASRALAHLRTELAP